MFKWTPLRKTMEQLQHKDEERDDNKDLVHDFLFLLSYTSKYFLWYSNRR